MSRFHWLVLAIGMMGFASFALVGCGDDEPTLCDTDADCAEGEICVNNNCAQTCFDADDCDNPDHGCSGRGCPEAGEPICFLECVSNEDCPEGQVCNTQFCDGRFGRCELPKSDQCASDDDCGEDEFCNLFTATCEARCTSDADCASGFLCNTDSGICFASGAECGSDDECGDGEVCRDSVCVPENPNACDDTSDCYALGDFYCGEVGSENECVSTACGSAVNTCSRCTLGANNGTKEANAPVIFFAEQVPVGSGQNCQPKSNKCGGEGAQLYCKFSFHFFDPDGDYTPANDNVYVVSGSGRHNTTFDVRSIGSGIAEFGACFPDGVNTPGTAVFVRDAANNASNTLCTIGTR